MKLAKMTYEVTKNFPKEEIYGITRQMRRAAVSIPSNIAEGSQRVSDKEFSNFVLIAKGSLVELETQFLLSIEFGFIRKGEVENLLIEIDELGRMLFSLRRSLSGNGSQLKAHISKLK